MRNRSEICRGLVLVALVWLVGLAPTLAQAPSASDPPVPPSSKIGPTLGLLLSLLEDEIPVDPDSALGQELAELRASGMVGVSAQFEHELSPEEQARIKQEYGVEFQEIAGGLAHLGPIYDTSVPTDRVEALAGDELTVWLEAAWRPAAPAIQPAAASPKVASSLGLLLSLDEEGEDIPIDPTSSLGQELENIKASGMVRVSARFQDELSPDDQEEIEGYGVVFQELPGEPAYLGPFYDTLVPTDTVGLLAEDERTVWLEATWRPAVTATLDRSVAYNPGLYTYVNAPAVWTMNSPLFPGMPLTGQGVLIANFDTGVDVFHPAFLKGSGGIGHIGWDTSGDGTFTPGTDQIAGVALHYWDAGGDPNNTGGFDVTQDWVYGDQIANGSYDSTEMIYMAHDVNGNGVLDAGEPLIERGTMGPGIPTSKIWATLNAGGVQRLRGIDLELTAPDTNGHGTSVSGILAAGEAQWNGNPIWPLARRYTGMAPDADLLVADRINVPFASYIPWAFWTGASVMLYEYGSWVQTYLDGSSNHEQMMNIAHQAGRLQVVPTGNLHCGGTLGCNPRHLQYSLPSGTTNYQFNVPAAPAMTSVWASMLWLNPANNLAVQVTTPGGFTTGVLPCFGPPSGWNWVWVAGDGHWVGCERAANSPRGTALYNIMVWRTSVATGNWTMAVTNPAPGAEVTNFYIADDSVNAWSFGSGWITAGGQEKHTATWPSTCDTCLGVASYATRGNSGGTIGDLSWFSGRGPRFFDGARIVDVAAPGHLDIITPQSRSVSGSLGSYNATFGGTSAAGPHVAGMGALLYQYAMVNYTTAAHVSWAIMQGAIADTYTGAVPNDNWGYGKLHAPGAVQQMMIHDLGDAPASANNAGLPMDAYPGVPANFPTVFGAAVPGPAHWWAGSLATGVWDSSLGALVSAEREADSLFDEEPTNNILPASKKADLDQPDDGLSFPGALPSCTPRPFNIFGTFKGTTVSPPPPWTRYVNIWADWNADGDWGDIFTCTTANDTPEWVVQDQPVQFMAPGPLNVLVPVTPYRGGSGGDPLWIRVSLSEMKATLDPGTGRADGRGPGLGYLYGETEDYLYPQTSFQVGSPICANDTLSFTHAPTSSWPVTFTWDFGDGTVVANPGPNPTHFYTQGGNHTVTLSGTHISGPFSVFTQTAVVDALPVASFTHSSPVCSGEPVTFTNASTGAAASMWDFGDATAASTVQNPTHTYATSGAYTVTLTVSSTHGCPDVFTQTAVVDALPVASFTYNSPVCQGQPMALTNTSTGATAYDWDFGDATTGSTVENPTHTYATTGTYTVTLTVSSTHGCPDVYAETVAVTRCQVYVYLPVILRSRP